MSGSKWKWKGDNNIRHQGLVLRDTYNEKGAMVKLNDLNLLRGQSTEILCVGFSDPKNIFVQTDF